VFAQAAYIKSSQPSFDAHFGRSALSGTADTLVAAQRDLVNVYAHDPTWRLAGDLVPSTPTGDFGSTVAMSSDGSTIAVGADGSVYVFRRAVTAWIQDARIVNTASTFSEEFAASLALSGDGDTVVVGSRNQSTSIGRVRTYQRGQDGWTQVASLGGGPDDHFFGIPLALAQDGSVLAARVRHGAANDYTVEVFVRTGDTWLLRTTLTSPDLLPAAEFGTSISCSARCETIAIGADEPPPPVQVPGMEGTGVAYVFEADGMAWTPAATLAARNAEIGDRFGTAVAISGDGSTIVVGATSESSASTGINGDGLNNAAPYAGAAYVFRRHRGAWAQVMYLKASNAETVDIFGSELGVAHDGTTIIVAAPYENGGSSGVDGDQTDNTQRSSGAIYAFEGTY
jgi:hypothetical protein